MDVHDSVNWFVIGGCGDDLSHEDEGLGVVFVEHLLLRGSLSSVMD